jgi:hypothetical protein
VPVLVGAAEEDRDLVPEVAGMMGGMRIFVLAFPGLLRHLSVFRLPGVVLVVVFDR